MVRNPLWRREKFEAKLDGSVAEIRVDNYKTAQVALHDAMADILVPLEEQAKTQHLEPGGVPVNEIPFYLNAMREFCRNCRNFTSQTMENECYNIYAYWVQKGLISQLVAAMGIMCGCDLWAYYY